MERQFDSLPVDVKNKFGNNAYVWIRDVGTDDWCKKWDLKLKVLQILNSRSRRKDMLNE